MSKEAMKLALEALEYIHEGANNQGPHTGISWRCVSNKAEPVITALQEALAEPQEKYQYGTPLLDAMTGKANEALDKKAENARALGLDYEPAQQEPVAWRTFDGEGGYEYRSYEMNEQYAQEWEQRNPKHKGWVETLYTTPPPCPTCEALARTVMLDQTSHDQFKPDWDTQAVLVEEQQRMAKRILELEALLERQTTRIVDLQTHIANLEGEE